MYYILLDTNFLYINYDKFNSSFEHFEFNKAFKELRKTIIDAGEENNCEVLVPALVVEELLKQRTSAYLSTVESFEKVKRALGIHQNISVIEDEKSFVERNRREAYDLFEKENVKIIKNCDNSYFENIVSDAIDKLPPFEGANGKSDKGFKDSVIWYSGIQYAKEKEGYYILLTKDDIFFKEGNSKYLESKFFKETQRRVKFAKECVGVADAMKSYKKENDIKTAAYIEEHQVSTEDCSNGCTVSVEWLKPILTNECNMHKEINSKIDDIYNSIFEEWESIRVELEKNLDEENKLLHFNDSLNYSVLYNDNGILSIRFYRYAYYDEGVHGMPYWIPRVFDLNSGATLGISDLIHKNDKDLLQLIIERFNSDFALRTDKYFQDFTLEKYHNINDFKFFFDKDGVHIYFDPYEAGCYASGFINFSIS